MEGKKSRQRDERRKQKFIPNILPVQMQQIFTYRSYVWETKMKQSAGDMIITRHLTIIRTAMSSYLVMDCLSFPWTPLVIKYVLYLQDSPTLYLTLLHGDLLLWLGDLKSPAVFSSSNITFSDNSWYVVRLTAVENR